MATKRKNPPDPALFQARRAFGQHIQDRLDWAKMSRKTLAVLLGYGHPASANQLITGQQGMSVEVYYRLLEVFPALRAVPVPPMTKVRRGHGSPGPHKPHEYPQGVQQSPPIRGRLKPKF